MMGDQLRYDFPDLSVGLSALRGAHPSLPLPFFRVRFPSFLPLSAVCFLPSWSCLFFPSLSSFGERRGNPEQARFHIRHVLVMRVILWGAAVSHST